MKEHRRQPESLHQCHKLLKRIRQHNGMMQCVQNAGIREQMCKGYVGNHQQPLKYKKVKDQRHAKMEVQQGCVLSQYLFKLILGTLMSLSLKNVK